jgi:hypothetical protein
MAPVITLSIHENVACELVICIRVASKYCWNIHRYGKQYIRNRAFAALGRPSQCGVCGRRCENPHQDTNRIMCRPELLSPSVESTGFAHPTSILVTRSRLHDLTLARLIPCVLQSRLLVDGSPRCEELRSQCSANVLIPIAACIYF